MIFKQGVLKEEKIKFIIVLSCVLIPFIALMILNLLDNENIRLSKVFLLVLYLPILFLFVLLGLRNLEWYYIYNDKIEARNIFGIKNIIHYKDVLFVEERTINLTSRGMKKQFYIFNDGRNNNNNIFNLDSCYNKKKFNFKIYKTPKMEEYIINTLNLQVNRK